MKVENVQNYPISYTSKNYPIKPFKIATDKGVLFCKELNYDKNYGNSYYKKIGEFFLDIFAKTSSHPFWEKCRKPKFDFFIYNDYVNDTISGYRQAVKDPDTTILLAKTKWGKLKAGIVARPLDIDNKVKDPLTLYIDSIAVDKRYRGNRVGKKLMQKVLNSSKERFEDVFLVAYKESVPFYRRLGFKNTKGSVEQSPSLKKVVDERIDYPEYAELMEKELINISGLKWYQRADLNAGC